MAVALWVTVWFSATHLSRNPSYPVSGPIVFNGDWLAEGWVRWDAGWYVQIAASGYSYTPNQMSSVAYFPAYPLAMRLVHLVTRDWVLAGVVLTALCGLGAVVLVHRWATRFVPSAAARLAVLLLVVYPYAWYLYGAIYADAFFLLFAVASFLLLEEDHPVLAGLTATVAATARPVGIGVLAGLVAVELVRREVLVVPFLDRVTADGWRTAWRERTFAIRVHLRNLRPGDAGLLLPIAGLVAWSAYLGRTFADPFLFANVQAAPGWDQRPGPHTWLKVTWFEYLRLLPRDLRDPHTHWDHLIYTLGITVQAALVIGCLCLVPLVIRRIGWGYAVYVVGVVGVPLVGSKDWQGTGRYLLAAFPVFAAVAVWMVDRRSPALRRVLVGSSAVVLLFLASSFARGHYLA